MLKVQVKLESQGSILSKILIAVQQRLNKIDVDLLRRAFQVELVSELKSSPTYQSLTNRGDPESLAADFGFRKGSEKSRVDAIISEISQSVFIKKTVTRRPRSRVTTFDVFGVPADYEDLYSLQESIVKSREHFVPWLQWILEFGDAEVISDYKVENDLSASQAAKSRSGVAIMVASDVGFSVRSGYEGVKGDNFITDAIKKVYENNIVSQVFLEEIRRVGRGSFSPLS